MKRILLVRPASPNTFRVMDMPFSKIRSFMTPLDLATIAGLTRDDIDVDVWDEAVRGLITESTFNGEYDVVGVTGFLAHARRAAELAGIFRKRGWLTAIGGSGVTTAPELYRDHFDVVFLGEGEFIWPRFIDDMTHGRRRKEYRQVTKVDLEKSPVPRWDKMAGDLKYYATGSVQTTRGCPNDCEFCDVVRLFGRRVRQKPIDQVLQEVATMKQLGLDSVFFCDDNFYGRPSYTKQLLKELISLNASFGKPFVFSTQITLSIADDDEVLVLLADAGFRLLLIGIETPNEASLAGANKSFNCKRDMVAAVRKIQSYAMWVRGAMVVGFDNDDPSIFERQHKFLRDAHIAFAIINPLLALPGTKLWQRMSKEKRLVHPYGGGRPALDRIPPVMGNMVVKGMPNREFITRYRDLLKGVTDWSGFEDRSTSMIDDVRRLPRQGEGVGMVTRNLWFLWFLFFRLNPKARRAAIRLLRKAHRKGAAVTIDVAQQIVSHYTYKTAIEAAFPRLDKILENPDSENPPVMQEVFSGPTDSFRASYKKLFPEVHDRVREGLADKSLVPEALVDVFVAFLAGVGMNIEAIDDSMRRELLGMCDTRIAVENDAVADAELVSRRTPADVPVSLLADDVLRCCEEELRSRWVADVTREQRPGATDVGPIMASAGVAVEDL